MTLPGEKSPQVSTAGFSLDRNANGVFRIRSASKALYQILDVDPGAPTGLWDTLCQRIHPEDRADFDAAFHDPDITQDMSWQGRLLVSGEIRIVTIDVQPVVSSTADTTWIGTLTKLPEAGDLNRAFAAVLEAAQAVMVRYDILRQENQWDPSGRVLTFDEDIPKLTMGRAKWEMLLHPEDREDVLHIMGEMERGTRQSAMLLYRRLNADGTWRWRRVLAGIGERDATGKPLSLMGFSYDVTTVMEELERVTAEAAALRDALDESKVILAQTAYELTENIPIGTYTMVLEPGGERAQFRFMSRRFLEITGLDAERARADPLSAFECVHPDDYDDWVQKNAHAFVHRKPFREETRLLVDGQVRWIVAESIPRLTKDGTWIWEGVIQDITDQKISEQALRRANQTLLEAASEKARIAEREALLKDIHDGFGNTLAIGKMRLRGGDVPATEAVEVIEDCLADLRILINSLDAEGESLWSVLGSLLERIAARARHLSLDLTWDLDASRRIYLRPRQMLQAARIVQEAVANAIRHSGAQAIHVAVTGGEQDGTGQIAIRDNGQGFDPKGHYRGRGLENMRQRANAEGWKLLFQAGTDDKGTQVTLDLGTG
jgi:PAS domain S-box-containing protein